MEIANLCYVMKGKQVLLMKKKRGIGSGKINGPGGRMKKGESPEEGAIREVKEELGIEVRSPKYRGIIEFINDKQLAFLCYVFTSTEFSGEPEETDEATPLWFDIDKIPFSEMWEDDIEWLPQVLAGKTILARFWFEDWKIKDRRIWFIEEN
ncbi:MAG: 8-oxo-dGTP diphosphatase [Candidatus Altiarchaeota archaeon]|nr:8-oxo-dGTP diphosphatase [Candidatus Altiarchaeota archaeon]